VSSMPLIRFVHLSCATDADVNQFEKEINKFWGTESVTNKQYLQTQAYRTFRIHVLLNIQRMQTQRFVELPNVICHLSDNYVLKYDSSLGFITLMRNVEYADATDTYV
jgi:hypothetical protein